MEKFTQCSDIWKFFHHLSIQVRDKVVKARCLNQYTILMDNRAQAICESLKDSLFSLLQMMESQTTCSSRNFLFTYTSISLELHPRNKPQEVFGMFDNDAATAIGERVREEAPESKVDKSARDLLDRRACVGSKRKLFQYRNCRLNSAFLSCCNLVRHGLDLGHLSHIVSVCTKIKGEGRLNK